MKRIVLPLAGIVLVLDQLTKFLIIASVPLHSRINLVDGLFDLTHVHNRGMAFGLFQTVDASWLRWVLVLVALAAVVIIWSYARHEVSQPFVLVAFGAILGGALGNLVDRLRFGYVVDFVLVRWGPHEFPAFNVADSAITMGGIVLFLALARDSRDTRQPEGDDDPVAPAPAGDSPAESS